VLTVTRGLYATLAEQYGHLNVPCESMARELLQDRLLKRYPWILGQVELEASLCASAGDRRALRAALSGSEIAAAHHYPVLFLRANAAKTGIYSALGDTHRAWSVAGEGLQTYWNGTYPRIRGYNALIVMDEINFPQGNWFLEAAILKEAIPMVADDPRTTMVAVEEARLGQTLIETGDFDEAERSFRQAKLLLSRSPPGTHRDALSNEVELGLAKVDLRRGRLSASVDRLETIRSTLSQIPDDWLLLDFYQTSGTAQLRSGHFDEAERDLNSAVKLAETDLRQIDTDDDRWKWSRHNEATYRALVELKLRADPTQALLDWEWYKGAALRGRYGRVFGEADTPGWLPASGDKAVTFHGANPETALISFAIFPQGVAVWIWNQDGVREQWIKLDESKLSLLAKNFTEQCSDPHSNPLILHNDGVLLYRKLILPIEPWLSGLRHLIMEPDGPLKALPIGLLVNSSGEYLGDHFVITISPGVAYLNLSKKWTGVFPGSNVLILEGSTVPGWAALPDAEQEAHTIASSFSHSRLISHSSLSTTVFSDEIAQADVFHFAGHAQATAESASLVTGPFDPLKAAQLQAFDRGRVQLVVLSACSTSSGTTGFFDDDDSMVRRLIGARVPEVVASRWMVDSGATVILMKNFYAQLLAGNSPSESLARASRALRAQPGFGHPFYWSSFAVFGRG